MKPGPLVDSFQPLQRLHLYASGKSQLRQETKNDLSVFIDVVEVDLVDGISGGVNVGVRVGKGALKDEGRWVSRSGSASVITAGVAASRLDEADAGVSVDQKLGEGIELSVGVIGDEAELVARAVSNHVLVKHSCDVLTFASVLLEDCLTSKETGLLASVPMKLNGVGCLAGTDAGVGEDGSECLQNGHAARTIIICTCCLSGGATAVDRVLVGTNDDCLGRRTLDGGDDGELRE